MAIIFTHSFILANQPSKVQIYCLVYVMSSELFISFAYITMCFYKWLIQLSVYYSSSSYYLICWILNIFTFTIPTSCSHCSCQYSLILHCNPYFLFNQFSWLSCLFSSITYPSLRSILYARLIFDHLTFRMDILIIWMVTSARLIKKFIISSLS